MARYFELIDEDAGRFVFWCIAIEGPALDIRHGPVGTAGKHEVEMCASDAAARDEYERRIATHVAGGYRECTDRRLDARTRALEDAIEADLDDAGNYLVYADWIQTLGDPRGGLIVAQAAAGDPNTSKRAEIYFDEHVALFLGPLAEHVGYDGSLLQLDWFCGFIRSAVLVARHLWSEQPHRVLDQLLDHPSARWLQRITIDNVDRYGSVGDTWSIQPVIDTIARRTLPFVRELVVGEIGKVFPERDDDDEDDYRWREDVTWHANVAFLWRAVPNLRKLVLRGDPGALGDLSQLPLEHVELHLSVLGRQATAALAVTHPQRLDLRYRSPQRQVADELGELLASPCVRGVEQLSITGMPNTRELVRLLASLKRPALRELDLSAGDLDDHGAEVLAETGWSLDILDVTHNRLSHRGIAALERIAKLVVAERQRRY